MIKRWGIELHPLKSNHLELLRTWRNSDFVRNTMQFQEYISESSQLVWFDSLRISNSRYFMIYNGSEFVGCCNIKNIDQRTLIGEGGVFLGESRFQKSLDAVKAVFLMYHWSFMKKGLQGAICEVLLDNSRATKLNKMLGFSMEVHDDGILRGSLTQLDFMKAYAKYNRVLSAS